MTSTASCMRFSSSAAPVSRTRARTAALDDENSRLAESSSDSVDPDFDRERCSLDDAPATSPSLYLRTALKSEGSSSSESSARGSIAGLLSAMDASWSARTRGGGFAAAVAAAWSLDDDARSSVAASPSTSPSEEKGTTRAGPSAMPPRACSALSTG